MIRRCLLKLIENQNLKEYHYKVKSLYDSFDDTQLEYLLNRGVTIDEHSFIFLGFHRAMGFRCTNINQQNVGKLPICNQIEKVLNEEYKNFVEGN